MCDEHHANFTSIKTLFSRDAVARVKTCEFHFKQLMRRWMRRLPENVREEFDTLALKWLEAWDIRAEGCHYDLPSQQPGARYEAADSRFQDDRTSRRPARHSSPPWDIRAEGCHDLPSQQPAARYEAADSRFQDGRTPRHPARHSSPPWDIGAEGRHYDLPSQQPGARYEAADMPAERLPYQLPSPQPSVWYGQCEDS